MQKSGEIILQADETKCKGPEVGDTAACSNNRKPMSLVLNEQEGDAKKAFCYFHKLLGSNSRLDTGFCLPIFPLLVPSGQARYAAVINNPKVSVA